jgi:uncharacterized membrane protein
MMSRPALHRVAWVNLALAGIAALAAVTTGMDAEVVLKPTHEAHQTLDAHKLFAFGSLGGILLLSAWRFALRGQFPRRAAAAAYIVMSLAGTAAITAAGYYGGEMVYTHGAGVRAIDQFTRDSYWKQVREVYRQQPPVPTEHAGHHE